MLRDKEEEELERYILRKKNENKKVILKKGKIRCKMRQQKQKDEERDRYIRGKKKEIVCVWQQNE